MRTSSITPPSVVACLALSAVVAVSACSDDDTKKNRQPGPDAGVDASGGDGGTAGSSTAGVGGTGATGGTGAAGGTGATGGAGGTGATGGAGGTGATGGAAGTGGTGGTPELVCNPPSTGGAGGAAAGAGGTGGTTAGTGGGAGTGSLGEWRDWANHRCESCPVPYMVCQDLVETATLNEDTQILTVHLRPSRMELTQVEVYAYWYDPLTEEWGEVLVNATVDKDTFTVDLTPHLPSGIIEIDYLSANIIEGCGDYRELQFYREDPPSLPVVNLECEAWGG